MIDNTITLSPHPTHPELIQGFDQEGNIVLQGKYVLGTSTPPPVGSLFPVALKITHIPVPITRDLDN